MSKSLCIVLMAAAALATSAKANAFELKSKDLAPGSKIAEEFVFNGFGCSGQNNSPELHWANPPKGTQSFALTVYDPDAPTGSGFWHWIVYNIPATVSSIEKNWKIAGTGASEVANDYGNASYGGPCPPPGKPHHYIFTVHALKSAKLEIPTGATSAVARFNIEAATIGKAKLTAIYGR